MTTFVGCWWTELCVAWLCIARHPTRQRFVESVSQDQGTCLWRPRCRGLTFWQNDSCKLNMALNVRNYHLAWKKLPSSERAKFFLKLMHQLLFHQLDSGIIIWVNESVNVIERLVLSLTKKQSSVSWTHLYAVIRRLERRAKYSCQSPSGVHLPSQYFIMTAFLENISGKFLAHHHTAWSSNWVNV